MNEPLTFAPIQAAKPMRKPVLVLAFCAVLTVAVAAISLVPNEDAILIVLIGLGLLAMIGICALSALAIGVLRFAGPTSNNDITKLICDRNPEGLLASDGDGKIIYANEAYLSLSGARGLADLRSVERLFSGAPEISESIYRLAQAAREGNHATEELRLAPPLGAETGVGWYKLTVGPLAMGSAKRASLWTVADVTRDRQRQEKIFQELHQAIDFLDQAPAGFFSCDAAGDVSYINATLASWLDYDLAEIGSGRLKLSDFVAGDGSALLASVGGSAGEVRTEKFDIDLTRRKGQNLPVRLLHSVTFDENGAPGASRNLVLNRAPGEEPAEDLRAAEVRFARIFNATPMAIAILDGNGCVSRSNAAFARLMPKVLKPNETAERSIYAGILDRDHPALETAIAAAARSTTDIPPVDVGLRGEGERSARLFVSALGDRDGNNTMIYALDTTEQRTLQTNFAQVQKMNAIGQLAGGVAHDFNNVLTAIIGYSDLLLANHRPTDPAFRDIMQIKQNANRAAGLVRQLLAFSRRQTLRPQVLQLGDVLSDLQMLMRRLVGEKIELDLRHGRDLWLVEADLNQFEQVIVNLIVNARDAMPLGGRINLRTRNVTASECADFSETSLVPADYVAIEVEDFGHGIASDVKDKIFEPFFTTKEVGKGTGLGLAMVYGIVKQTGGYVFCSSTVGKGTVFSILLPRYVPDVSLATRAPETTKAPPADLTGHGTILLVEDEEAVRAFGARALASRGYTVLQAASGVEALRIVEQNEGKIDLVVSDVVMPEMDGPTMFGELRKRGVKARVIFVSGYAEDAFAKNLPEGEDFSFLPKPFSLKQLIEAVKGNQSGRT
ncbi:hybrid sensor histidine kinase/response regulator [Beijerinckiaceae bacterium]|nr:hybrid sensor histidine kinase/response regulator [Beijerinckiaceae bacterium]